MSADDLDPDIACAVRLYEEAHTKLRVWPFNLVSQFDFACSTDTLLVSYGTLRIYPSHAKPLEHLVASDGTDV